MVSSVPAQVSLGPVSVCPRQQPDTRRPQAPGGHPRVVPPVRGFRGPVRTGLEGTVCGRQTCMNSAAFPPSLRPVF